MRLQLTPRPGPAVGRIVALMAVLALLGVPGLRIVPGAAAQSGNLWPPSPGESWRIRALNGPEVALESLMDRPVLLNVWATWCVPCVAELRSLERLNRSLPPGRVRVIVVSPEDHDHVAQWAGRRAYDLPLYVEVTRMPEGFGLNAVPTTWVMDSRGRVVLRRRGAADWDRDDVRALLLSLPD